VTEMICDGDDPMALRIRVGVGTVRQRRMWIGLFRLAQGGVAAYPLQAREIQKKILEEIEE